jgi:hypothetical protein
VSNEGSTLKGFKTPVPPGNESFPGTNQSFETPQALIVISFLAFGHPLGLRDPTREHSG